MFYFFCRWLVQYVYVAPWFAVSFLYAGAVTLIFTLALYLREEDHVSDVRPR